MNETNKDVAADVKDDLLTKAAADAVNGQDQRQEIEEEIAEVEEKIEEAEKEDAEGLPTDQKERSQLGRTLAALHRRLDEFDQRDADRGEQIDKLLEAIKAKNEPEFEDDDDVPLTRSQLKAIMKEEREAEIEQTQKLSKKYHQDYGLKWAELAKNLSDEEYNFLMAEAEEMKYDPSDNGAVDAAVNFKEAQVRYYKKQLGTRTNPLDKNKPKNIGTVKTQKVPDREIALPKLDEAAQSYLNYVSREDGAEAATNLHKTLAK